MSEATIREVLSSHGHLAVDANTIDRDANL